MGWQSAAIAHTRVSRNFSPGPARHGQFNRTFLVGLTASQWPASDCSRYHAQPSSETRGAPSLSRVRPTAACEGFPRGRRGRRIQLTANPVPQPSATGRQQMNEKLQTKMVSRRKALFLLGFGAAVGFTLSSALEPLEAEAQEATTPAAAPPAATGTHGMQRRQGRRTHRSERRHGRHERRHTRRTGEPAPAATTPAQ